MKNNRDAKNETKMDGIINQILWEEGKPLIN